MIKTLIPVLATVILSQCFNSAASEKKAEQSTLRAKAPLTATAKEQKQETDTPKFLVEEAKADSILAEQLINNAAKSAAADKKQNGRQELLLHIARSFIGTPYMAQTLEGNKDEQLVVNLRQLDCTTYIENVLAIYLCVKNNTLKYSDFKTNLRMLRYIGEKVSYPSRLHYFTEWIEENTDKGLVHEIQSPNPPFTAIQRININYMSKHYLNYPMLKANPTMVDPIAHMEQSLSDRRYRYIPKSQIANNKLYRQTIHDGDIIAIITKKEGLDTSHIGMAVWHKDGLHMLNASQIHKKVVEEPMTLYQYMQKHPSQTGIRIVRVK